MLLENNPFPHDARVRREARSLTTAGYAVSVIAPRGKDQPWRERIAGVDVYRFPRPPDAQSAFGYVCEYGYAMLAIFVLSLYVWLRRGLDVVHLHNPPDCLFPIAAFYKLLGKKFVFDHHDLWPEMYEARFPGGGNRFIVGALTFCERQCCRLADLIVATNESAKEREIGRSKAPADRVVTVRNGPEAARLEPVAPAPDLAAMSGTLLVYIGVMGRQDGLDYLLRSFRRLLDDFHRRDFHCVLIGRGDALEDMRALAGELRLNEHVTFAGYLPPREFVRYLAAADVGVDPDPSNDYNDRCTMMKLTDYMASGLPIVAFDLPEHRVTAGDAALYARANDETDFARQIVRLMDDSELRQTLGRLGRRRLRDGLLWEHQEKSLLEGYARRVAGTASSIAGSDRGATTSSSPDAPAEAVPMKEAADEPRIECG